MKIALIGYGYWGPNIARNLNKTKKADLYAICDMDENNLDKARKLYGDSVRYVRDYHELIDDADAFCIALRQNVSYPIAMELLEKKKHLFMEKPLATSTEQVINLGRMSEKYGVTLHADHIMVFHPINILWGIVPVHEFGLCCDIHEINRIASEYSLKVIEDAACALGAKIGETHQGGFGNPSCISFHPRKSITTGEGGMIMANDEAMAKRMKELRTHGSTISADARHKGKGFLLPEFNEAGYNYRMTDIQAAVGMAQVEKLDWIIAEKQRRASLYNQLIGELLPEFIVPHVPEGYYHTYQSYVCMLDLGKLGLSSVAEGGEYRNTLLQKLEDLGIATRQGTHAVHMLGYYRNRFGYRPEDYPTAYACDHLSITLPLYVQMSDADQEYVIKTIRETIDTV